MNYEEENKETGNVKLLISKRYLKYPKKCMCGNSNLQIQYDSNAKIFYCIFRCQNP